MKLIGIIALVVLVFVLANTERSGGPNAPPPNPCKADWTKCVDNGDMVNNYRGWSDVKFACKRAANDRASYGTPEWPWIEFGTYLVGTDYPKTGKVTAIEEDAKFQNGFGAMVRSRVHCKYDMHQKKVTFIDISRR